MRLLLVDDHHVVREALTLFIQRAAQDIAVMGANSIDQALEKLASAPPYDVVLLDYHMPGMNGLAGLARVRAAAPNAQVAILSGNISAEEGRQAIERGARGVILKSIRGTGLITTIRQIVSGEIVSPPSVQISGRAQPHNTSDAGMRLELGQLTAREFDCVKLLIRGSNNREIADVLSLAEVTVKLHLHSAYKKMGARNRSDAVRISMLKGMVAL